MPRWMNALALVTMSGGCVLEVHSRSESISFDEDIVGVVTDLDEGDVRVTSTAIYGAELFQQLEWSGREPDVRAEVIDGVLYVTTECRVGLGVCRIDQELIVPEGAWLELQTGAGNIDIKGTDADVVAGTGAGDIALSSASGLMVLETGSGNITMSDVLGEVAVSTGSGTVWGEALSVSTLEASTGSGDVELEAVTSPGTVDIQTGSGDVYLVVPSGVYALDLSTGSGRVDISNITSQDSAPRLIEVGTGSGDVNVWGR
jgi:hypothetical protein